MTKLEIDNYIGMLIPIRSYLKSIQGEVEMGGTKENRRFIHDYASTAIGYCNEAIVTVQKGGTND